MNLTLDEIEERLYKISASFRCARSAGVASQDCGHPGCVSVYAYWQSMQEYFKTIRKCPECEGTGKRKVSLP